jgi:hypothetical protein
VPSSLVGHASTFAVQLVLKTVNYVEHDSVVLAREIVETGEIMVLVVVTS